MLEVPLQPFLKSQGAHCKLPGVDPGAFLLTLFPSELSPGQPWVHLTDAALITFLHHISNSTGCWGIELWQDEMAGLTMWETANRGR